MRWLVLILALAMPFAASAQEDDEGRLVRFIEERLSDGAARQIDLQGFRGALSSSATLDRLTVADADGIWLTIEGAELDWNRAAILRGVIDIEALTADRIILDRLPATEDATPQPEATGFTLPDLPVSISIETAEIGLLSLGETVLGHAVDVSASAAMELAGGSGTINLDAARQDGQVGTVTLFASYDAANTTADINLTVSEAEGGLAASLLDLPGAPSVDLSVVGRGPIADFRSALTLATDGQDRLTAQVETMTPEDGGWRLAVDAAGDLSPILRGSARDFIGDDTLLDADIAQAADGQISVDRFSLTSGALQVSGSGALDADRQPLGFDVAVELAAETPGATVRLPGGEAQLTRASFDLSYDRSGGDAVTGRGVITGFHGGGLDAASIRLTLDGALDENAGSLTGLQADVALQAEGLGSNNPDVAAVIGDAANLRTAVTWSSEDGLTLRDVALTNAAVHASGNAQVTPAVSRVDIETDLAVQVADLRPFSGLAGLDLAGTAQLDLALVSDALSGAFDTQITATTNALRVGDLPDLFPERTDLMIDLARDAEGVHIRQFELVGREVDAGISGQIASLGTEVAVEAQLASLALLDDRLDGPLSANLTLIQASSEAPWQIPDLRITTGFADLTGAASVDLLADRPRFETSVFASVPDFAALAGIAGMPLGGSAQAELQAGGLLSFEEWQVDLDGVVTDLSAGGVVPAGLLADETTVRARVLNTGSALIVETAEVAGRNLDASASGSATAEAGAFLGAATLRNAQIVAPVLAGSVSADWRLARDAGQDWMLDATVAGPGGLTVEADGAVLRPDGSVDLGITGRAPLGLVNRVLAPRNLAGDVAFDLRVRGQPSLNAVSGTVSTQGARLAAPTLTLALENLQANATLSGGRASFTSSGTISTGGVFQAEGTVSPGVPGLPLDVAVSLRGARIVDPTLYEAIIDDAQVSVSGGATSGLTASGQINVGTANIRVPDTTIGHSGTVPVIDHIGETAAERQTRRFAGLLGQGAGSGGPDVALDLGISAPARIFVRGRGLDAELGGTVTLSGTAAAPVAAGQFELIRGRLSLLGQRFDLTQGLATLQGGAPYLELTAETTAGEYTIFIEIAGRADAPEVRFRSSPELPEDEVLSQLFFGRSTTTLSPIQALQLADAVGSLAGGGSSAFTLLREGLGLDDLDINTNEDGSTGLRAGRYLSENIYTDVIIDNEGNGVSLNIDLTPSVTARGSVNTSGESAIGLFFERDY